MNQSEMKISRGMGASPTYLSADQQAHGRGAHAAPAKPGLAADHDKLVKQAQIWVSQTFFGTLLKQMRQSSFKSEMFSGGRGGEAFSDLYDQQLPERMARRAAHK